MLIGECRLDAMTPGQRSVHDRIASGPRGSVPLPFFAMLDSPGLAAAIQAVGETIRYRTRMSDRLREIAICAAAAAFGSGYEWEYHDRLAVAAGLGHAERTGILDGTGAGLLPQESVVVAYVFIAIRERRADPEALGAIVAAYGREIASEITSICGYYPLLALFLSAGALNTPMPQKIA
jgi:4-carboxymuconolactone decarboxylase